jgi:hypothetical protein
VINVTNRPNVHVRLTSFKFLLRHVLPRSGFVRFLLSNPEPTS